MIHLTVAVVLDGKTVDSMCGLQLVPRVGENIVREGEEFLLVVDRVIHRSFSGDGQLVDLLCQRTNLKIRIEG